MGRYLFYFYLFIYYPSKKGTKDGVSLKKKKTHTKNKLQHITYNRTNYKDEKQKLNYTLHCRYVRNFTF